MTQEKKNIEGAIAAKKRTPAKHRRVVSFHPQMLENDYITRCIRRLLLATSVWTTLCGALHMIDDSGIANVERNLRLTAAPHQCPATSTRSVHI